MKCDGKTQMNPNPWNLKPNRSNPKHREAAENKGVSRTGERCNNAYMD